MSKTLQCLSRTWLTWSRLVTLRSQARCVHSGTINRSEKADKWNVPLHLKESEFDVEYLLDPTNHPTIRADIVNRKGVGDIDKVVALWKKLDSEQNEEEKQKLKTLFLSAASDIPNRSHPQSPIGDEENARQVGLVGTRKEFPKFIPRTMVELGEGLGMLRTSNVNITTGNGTYYFVDKLAMLEQALINYTIDNLLAQGFQLISVPDLLHPEIIERCGFKTTGDVTQVYRLDPERHGDLCLAGTSEMALGGYFLDEELEKKDLPLKLAAVSRCYRAETSHAEEESGIYRVHQFTKVEMFGVAASDSGTEGDELLAEFIDIEKSLFTRLALHFRVLDMPTAELGAPAYRKFDIEAWMPGKRFWGEISSASNCTDYQSRRLGIQYRDEQGRLRHCTTVNGTACAVPRTIMALCETLQQQDGSITLPAVLWDYMDGQRHITKCSSLPNLQWIKSNKLK